MGFIATNKGGKDFPICPAGMHLARCYMMVDLGTQPAFGLEKEAKQKLRLGFEFPTEKHVFFEDKGEEPFTLSKKYTKSTHEKSGLRKDLESWRGRPFTSDEIEAFDVSKVLGIPCMINVIHKKKEKSDDMRAEIASISPVPKGMKCPPAVLPPLIYDMDKPDPGVLNVLPPWIQKEISEALEHKGVPSTGAADAGNHDQPGEDEHCPF